MPVLDKQLLVRLNGEEKEAWDEAASAAGVSTNTFVRLMVNTSLGKTSLGNSVNRAMSAQKVKQAERMREARKTRGAATARSLVRPTG